MAGVTFEHVYKRFGEITAVSDFDLEIPDKEFLVLVGPSGCGKSTTLRMLAGLEEITEGTIRIGDRDVTHVPAKDRDIAMVFQSYALYPHMTVYDNMAFGLTLRKVPKDEIRCRVEDAGRILGIEALLDRKPRALSGGQRQRVALGRAIVRDPAVFLFDEPLSNLDAKLRVQTRAEISKLHHRLGTTFIYVTHDQVEAMTMATRIVVMRAGLIMQVGTPGQLYDHPTNMFVAGFIGSPAMNFFTGTVVHEEGRLFLDLEGFRLPVPDDRRRDVEAFTGNAIVAGMRPENIHAEGFSPPGISSSTVQAEVVVTELLGNETIAYLQMGEHEFLARLDPRVQTRPGQNINLAVDIDRVHIFDPESEDALGTTKPQTAPV
ncbi:MAG TPA: sn-glycerol-3-phosphate ABC transporter ATP-binding protein UgpC [Dehalococcoidia bacterium]|nr:sn-glycerol-3-phosphate ABC transporter ATP-binding protein UgpC [Dehalococcoidia bacterium]